MFIKILHLIFLYIDRMDWRAGHLTTTEGTGGGHLPTKIAGRAGHLRKFSNARGMPGGLPGGMLAAGNDSHINAALFKTVVHLQVWKESC